MADSGPPIDGYEALIREVTSLRNRVRALENGSGRSIGIGTSYRIEVRGALAAAQLWAVRSADGNSTQLAP